MVKLLWRRLDGENGHTAGRALLRQLYEETFSRPMPEILTTDRGKPYFIDNSCHFSISHSKNHAFCAISDKNIAIDAEETDRPIRLALAEKMLSDNEKAIFDTAEDPRLTLLKFWVLKEAAAKLSGFGLHGCPDKSDFSPEHPGLSIIDGCIVAVLQEESYAF